MNMLSVLCSLQDNHGLNDTATVVINIVDYDNLNPYFSHSVYQAFIPENEVRLLNLITTSFLSQVMSSQPTLYKASIKHSQKCCGVVLSFLVD